MTKQIRITTDSLSPLFKASVGFDRLVNEFFNEPHLHKGIAERNFIRTFKLAEYVEVKDAKLEDGILRVQLFRNMPEALKPQKIEIS